MAMELMLKWGQSSSERGWIGGEECYTLLRLTNGKGEKPDETLGAVRIGRCKLLRQARGRCEVAQTRIHAHAMEKGEKGEDTLGRIYIVGCTRCMYSI